MKLLFIYSLFIVPVLSYWHTENQQIFYQDEVADLKGLNWYGFETGIYCIEGLWANPISYYMELMSNHSFNALRIPISEKMILYDKDYVPEQTLVTNETSVYNQTWLTILDSIVDQAQEHGIAILLDIHRIRNGVSTPLWFVPENEMYTELCLFQAWFDLVDRYSDKNNFMGIDLYNEPHGIATWGDNNYTDYKAFIERIVPTIADRYPLSSFLFLFNGINWGKDMKLYAQYPITGLDYLDHRIVYSPHNYGPSINKNIPNYSAPSLYADWNNNFGYLTDLGKTVVIGEWGGIYEDPQEKVWMDTFVDYMIQKNMKNNFFFALNPFASDVQGLLKSDWSTPKYRKLKLLERLQPNPTKFNFI